MKLKQAVQIARSSYGYTRKSHVRIRRDDWTDDEYVVLVNACDAVHDSRWSQAVKVVWIMVKVVFDRNVDPRLSFDTRWRPSPDDQVRDWNVSTS